MKITHFVLAWAVLAGGFTGHAAPPVSISLTDDGILNKVHTQLEQIFQFAFDGPRLKLDRKGWGDPPKNPPKVNVVSFNNGPPIEAIFHNIRSHAGQVTSSGTMMSNRYRELHFSGSALSGRIRTSGDAVRMELEEMAGPRRSLEWVDDGQGALRLMLSSTDGDLILLQQSKTGAATLAGVLKGKPFAAHGDSFLAMYRQQRGILDAQVLPALQSLSIRLIPSPATVEMKKAVLALLSRTPETLEECKKLLGDLDNDKFAVRDRASKLLNERFEIYKDLIQDKLKESNLSQEMAARLNKLMAAHPDAQKVSLTIAALDLLRDPAYLVDLLEDANPDQRARVFAQLETATGQRLGTDVAAWKRWLEKK